MLEELRADLILVVEDVRLLARLLDERSKSHELFITD